MADAERHGFSLSIIKAMQSSLDNYVSAQAVVIGSLVLGGDRWECTPIPGLCSSAGSTARCHIVISGRIVKQWLTNLQIDIWWYARQHHPRLVEEYIAMSIPPDEVAPELWARIAVSCVCVFACACYGGGMELSTRSSPPAPFSRTHPHTLVCCFRARLRRLRHSCKRSVHCCTTIKPVWPWLRW